MKDQAREISAIPSALRVYLMHLGFSIVTCVL